MRVRFQWVYRSRVYARQDKGTDASWLRMFEMEGIVLPEVSPRLRVESVNDLLIGLAVKPRWDRQRYATLSRALTKCNPQPR